MVAVTTMDKAIRTTAHVVRLADLDNLYEAVHQPMVREASSVRPLYPRAVDALDDLSEVRPAATTSRQPNVIGSTLPAPLGHEQEVEALPRPRAAKRQRRRGPVRDVPRLPHGEVQQWPVRFDATGQGYARIWLGNALLLILTLGLAWPWTHRRSQRHFLRHTEVAGHRMDFYLPNRLLMPRLGMTAALWLGLVGASVGSFWTGMAALTLGTLVWPLLVYLQINHQVSSITWAGRALWFDGPWTTLYKVSWLPLALFLGAAWAMAAASHQATAGRAWQAAAAMLVLWLLYLPSAAWSFYRYRQHHIRLGPLRLQWQAKRGDIWAALGRSAASAGMWALLIAGALALLLSAWLAWQPTVPRAMIVGAAGLAVTVVTAMWIPSMDAAMLEAVWNRSGNRHLRFRSRLSRSAYTRLFARNTLRLVLTLGLYWPWAVVSTRRMRWQAMTVWSRVDAEVLMAYWLPEADPLSVQPDAAAARDRHGAESQTTQPSFVSRYGTLD